MNDLKEKLHPQRTEIVIKIDFVDGEFISQLLPVDHADKVQKFINWYRKPGLRKVWTWQTPTKQKMRLIHHRHIECIFVEGYIEPEGRSSRWYERLLDRFLVRWRWR